MPRLRLLLPLMLLAASGPPARAQLSLTLGATGATVSGLAPGARVALLAAMRHEQDYSGITYAFDSEQIDTDNDGALSWDLGQPLEPKTVVVAVELATGAYTWATPAEFPLAVEPLPNAPWLLSPDASLAGWRLPANRVKTVLVRPGVGAWLAEVWEGRPGLSDTELDGEAVLDFSSLHPLAAESPWSGPPQAGDRLVGLAPNSFEIWAWQVTGTEANGGGE
ncbi:MAG TPA: hypothetical protein PK413_21640 [Thermoanaerobaculia bacterium]|nr:hypothetical protein [Thermoanaerobaculia bacterium]